MLTATQLSNRSVSTLLLCMLLSFASAKAVAAKPAFDYLLHCAGCHLEDGVGMVDAGIPDLNEHTGNFATMEEGRAYLIRVPGSSQSPLSDADLAVLLNWMVDRFAPGVEAEPFTEEEVTAHRRNRMHNPPEERAVLVEKIQAASADVNSATATVELSAAQQRAFGQLLFSDTSLSRNGNQACASCHDPGRAFSDARPASISAGASFGSDDKSLGHRNAPALTYVAQTPVFSMEDLTNLDRGASAEDAIRGGFFWDGREPTLEAQVLTPFVNAREMGLADLNELGSRVLDNPVYADFVMGATSPSDFIEPLASALTSYLRSDALNAFDSRYDRYLKGEVEATRKEVVGMGLFFSPGFTSCAQCHQSSTHDYAAGELFTNHRYENIGAPVNPQLLAASGYGEDYIDSGLAENPQIAKGAGSELVAGRIKVPSLRNVAVTGPYMHNGVFDELSTVMLFYNHFNETGDAGQTNPETGAPWQAANYPDQIVLEKLRSGFPLSPVQIEALTAFLRMLTDQQYEHLLD
ncbi:hypothetical protein GCM10011403_08150 [Pseudohongiella nitratireducens]|uniref:Cytochrome c domain-containing protein n=1 Tax=Pseudohongiella nitratireducens TaxID=1768907 RepID=A0A917GQ80_9GAMM|nr:cytochrome c peroxidase [Pseudohongiella nitratireducens]GGG53361.1 hypothetical protein GCM10011403_08150 [Pseudohongiella nitratireducens]